VQVLRHLGSCGRADRLRGHRVMYCITCSLIRIPDLVAFTGGCGWLRIATDIQWVLGWSGKIGCQGLARACAVILLLGTGARCGPLEPLSEIPQRFRVPGRGARRVFGCTALPAISQAGVDRRGRCGI